MRTARSRVLIITYYWPPSGGAGVQRWLKFSKYLPSAGWIPVILTVDPEYAAYPSRDTSLFDEVPIDIEVHRTKAVNYFSLYNKDSAKIPHAGFSSGKDDSLKGIFSRFIRGNFFIPDPRRGWNNYAYRKACRLIREENISHIITTSPPHSTQLIGLRLKRRFPSIRWVADLRDPWTDIYYYDLFRPSLPARMIDRAMEKKVLTKADTLITVGPSLAALLGSKADDIEERIHLLPNGFDEEDFENMVPADPAIFTITYVGTLSQAYPLTAFTEAVKSLNEKGVRVKTRFVGSIPEIVREQIPAYTEDNPEFIPYCDHPEAIRHMISASMLLLVIPDHLSRRSILTGKIFEYMAAGKPILFIGPTDGDAAHILRKCGYDGIFGYDEADNIRDYIKRFTEGAVINNTNHHLEYSRRALTAKLGEILDLLPPERP